MPRCEMPVVAPDVVFTESVNQVKAVFETPPGMPE